MATKPATADNSITQAGKTIYLNNKELMIAVKESKAQGRMTNTLAKMLQLLCSKYAKKGNFINYSYNDDMQSYAMLMLVKTWNSFDPEKGSNPFAFFTQCVKNSFIQYLKHEGKHRVIRDQLLIDQGLNPSYGYDDSRGDDDENTEPGQIIVVKRENDQDGTDVDGSGETTITLGDTTITLVLSPESEGDDLLQY